MKQRSRKAERAALERQRRKEQTFRDDAGRVHLSVQRDPATGRERIGFKSPVFETEWQNELALSAANTVFAALGQKPTLERIVEVTRRAMASTSELINGLLSRAPAGALACKAACDHCCYQVVGVTAAEALTIFDYLQRTRTDEQREALRVRIRDSYERARGLSSAERFSPAHPCIFLSSGKCSIYEVRPLSCRGMNSLDAGECEARLRDPEARAAFLAKGHGGRSFMEPIQAFRAISAGLQLGLAELYRLDARPLDLTGAMYLLFENPASLGTGWVAGQKPFEPALRAPGG